MPLHEGDDTLLRTAGMGCVNYAGGVSADAPPVGSRGLRGLRGSHGSHGSWAAR